MIGDGMGSAQIYAALTVKKDKLNIARCKYIGLVKTYSADDYVTDSAAGATAFATGKKTNNGFLNVDPNGARLTTILEISENHGLSTGLVATCSVTHATPAGFIAHTKDRDDNERIALDFLKTDVDVFIGGGYKFFIKRHDKLNLIDSLKKRNYIIAGSLSDLEKIHSGKIAGLLYDEQPPEISYCRGEMLRLASLKATEILDKNDKGFFLMIEGSQIDWGEHKKNIDYTLSETLDFDNVVGNMLDFAENDGETLVIITADHETGGLTLPGGSLKNETVKAKFSTRNHTGVWVPVFAFGPGAEEFTGVMENTDIFNKMIMLYGFN